MVSQEMLYDASIQLEHVQEDYRGQCLWNLKSKYIVGSEKLDTKTTSRISH